ncbi:magnesium chelatase domain-containing protein [Lentibacillus kapialis]|uniref:magnesium chelatase domain-containing protein n=1 Tax=Lentibacillus kapialis TaxID=340214 RepID=UPI001E54B256|nr:magnesium chelatase domain-containing protein [Lentibacillus kapialis]
MEGVNIVGLPDASVKESKDRVMAALYANNCEVPDKKIVINLSPAEQKKNSPIFDFAMAIGVMKESGDLKETIPDDAAFLGVLSLGSTIKPVDGMLPAIVAAKKEGVNHLCLTPMKDTPFPQIDGMDYCFVETLHDVVASFSGQLSSFAITSITSSEAKNPPEPVTYNKDFQHILGHKQAKRALEITAVCGHNVLMTGPLEVGKVYWPKRFHRFCLS